MFVEIVGKSVKTPNLVVEKAATFYGEYLLTKRMSDTINLSIEFEKFPRGSNDYAYCDYAGDNHKPKDFIITIERRLCKKETLLALAHEMTHLSQYARGELKDLFRPVRMTKWRGIKYNADTVDYWSAPWERESRGMEMELYVKFWESENK